MTNLNRCYGQGYLHYITTSCYQRRPLLALASRRDLFVEALEHVRRRYHFVVVGYVAMPEHIHLLLSEPKRGNPSTVMGGWPTFAGSNHNRGCPTFASFAKVGCDAAGGEGF